jgi:hypothetical protein
MIPQIPLAIRTSVPASMPRKTGTTAGLNPQDRLHIGEAPVPRAGWVGGLIGAARTSRTDIIMALASGAQVHVECGRWCCRRLGRAIMSRIAPAVS